MTQLTVQVKIYNEFSHASGVKSTFNKCWISEELECDGREKRTVIQKQKPNGEDSTACIQISYVMFISQFL